MPQRSRPFPVAARSPGEPGTGRPAAAGGARIDGRSPDLGSLSETGTDELRVLTANAVTAILLHCDAIRHGTGPGEMGMADIHASLAHIVTSARRIWNEVGKVETPTHQANLWFGRNRSIGSVQVSRLLAAGDTKP